MSREVVIVAYGRSAVCKSRKGSFAGTHPIEYSAQVLKGVLESKMLSWVVQYSTVQHL